MDIKGIINSPVENVYFMRDPREQADLRIAYAMVIGTRDTPYDGVPMFYSIVFPNDYPYSPPKFKFLTYKSAMPNPGYTTISNGRSAFVRMHPNYYVNGKCCLSVLNTWRGRAWSGCQTISSVLSVILMTLTEFPLENEPGKSGTGAAGLLYRSIILDAGLDIIRRFLTDELVITFTDSEDGNSQIINEFKKMYIEHLLRVPSDMSSESKKTNGERLLSCLKNKNSRVNKELSQYTADEIKHEMTYSFDYRFCYTNNIPKITESLTDLISKR